MSLLIPIDSTDPSFVQEVPLDGQTFRLLFRWNARGEEWYLTISDVDDVVIAASRKLVENAALLRHVADATTRPLGELFLVGIATRDNLGTEAILLYLTAEEMAA